MAFPRVLSAFAVPAFAVALASGCGDAPSVDILATEAPEPGDPAIFAPPGWPLEVGDRVTDTVREQLRKEFLSPHYWAIHVVGNQLYAAQWDWPDEPHDYSRLVYAGHFPVKMPWHSRDEEENLPERFHGKIEYEPRPPYRVQLYGTDMYVDERGYLSWREYQRRVAERRVRRDGSQ